MCSGFDVRAKMAGFFDIFRRGSAHFEVRGAIQLRPFVATNHGREARYGDCTGFTRITPPALVSPPARAVPTFLRRPGTVLQFLPAGEC